MALPNMSVPLFPNVPDVLGVPPVRRAPLSVGINSILGDVAAQVNTLTGGIGGAISGTVTQPNGALAQVTGSFSGILDQASNSVTGAMTGTVQGGGPISGSLLGTVLGTVNGSTGGLIGSIQGQLSNLTGSLNSILGDGDLLGGSDNSTIKWGIFDTGGQPVIVGQSVLGIEYGKEYRISDYPVEDGAFQSYSKVETPFDARITFTQGGTDADRTAFLTSVADAVDSTTLYSIHTPEVNYDSANLTHYTYRREQKNGATLLTVEVMARQVRVTATATYTSSLQLIGNVVPITPINVPPLTPSTVQIPSAAAIQNIGAVQAQALSASLSAQVAGLF
jgi:hypothetical protein